MLMISDQDTYNHNRSVYNKGHDFMVGELQISPESANILKARYEAELIEFKRTGPYRKYYMIRRQNKSAKQAAGICI